MSTEWGFNVTRYGLACDHEITDQCGQQNRPDSKVFDQPPGQQQAGHDASPNEDPPGNRHHLNARLTSAAVCIRTIELACDKLAIPAENRVRLGGGRHAPERLTAQPVTDVSERLLFSVLQ